MGLVNAVVPADKLDVALRWIVTGCAVRALATDIEKATRRIHDLVSSVKRFSYMDRSVSTEVVDLAQGLADTIAVLRSKARAKSIEVSLDIASGLPPLIGTGSELNQIWLNLIDNALDASPEGGGGEVLVGSELDWITVKVIDHGEGVPAEIQQRVFDQFFTTKPPGQGTGMGLDIARNLVEAGNRRAARATSMRL